MIADDTRKPMDPSGIRFGTPAMTTRGFGTKEATRVADTCAARRAIWRPSSSIYRSR